jgi:hypothetical protein
MIGLVCMIPSGIGQMGLVTGVDHQPDGNDQVVTLTLAFAWALYAALLGVLAVVLLRGKHGKRGGP